MSQRKLSEAWQIKKKLSNGRRLANKERGKLRITGKNTARRLSEEDAEKLWDLGKVLVGISERIESRGDSAWVSAIGRELQYIVARSGG